VTEGQANSFWWDRRCLPAAGCLAGLLLMLPSVFPVAAPVQGVAFVPLLLALRRVTGWRQCLYTGLLLGLGFIAPQILLLQLPPIISLILIAYFVALLTLLAVVGRKWVRPTTIAGCFAFGALAATLDWATTTALPMWGTAQSFVRGWSAYPRTMAFTSVTGMSGAMFVLGATQALLVILILDRRRRVVGVVTLVGLLAVVAAVDLVILVQKPVAHLKVAGVGWIFDREYGDPGHEQGFARLYAQPVAEAARQGARLVVSPEVAFAIYDAPQHDPFARFVELARQHNVYLIVGYLDVRTVRNCAAFISPTEGVMGRYAKVHITPFENSPKGDGEPVTISVDGVSVGALICHDDNYTDIARRYGDQATGVVAIPTNDWRHVRHAHLQSMIHRAIESRFAIVRAASDGISAIIAPDGTLLDVRDHFRDGPGLIQADVPVYHTRTLFSRYGHWFVVVCTALLVLHLVQRRRHAGVGWALAHADSSDDDKQHGLKPILPISNDTEEKT